MSNEVTTAIAVPATITPMTLIDRALQSNASIDQMQQLFELQLRYEANEAKKAYHAAVADFKAESIVIIKDKQVRFETQKGKTEYKHATLGSIILLVVPILSKYGLSHSWSTEQVEGAIKVTCHLTHAQGHSTSVSLSTGKDESGGKNSIQAVGSTVSYLERYTFLAITGLASQDQDDDGKTTDKKKVETIDEGQIAILENLIADVKANAEQFCTFFKVAEIADLPATKYNQAVTMLEKKRSA